MSHNHIISVILFLVFFVYFLLLLLLFVISFGDHGNGKNASEPNGKNSVINCLNSAVCAAAMHRRCNWLNEIDDEIVENWILVQFVRPVV